VVLPQETAAVAAAAKRMIAKHYVKDAEIMSDLSKTRRIPQPKGSVGRRRQARHKLRCGNRLAQAVIQAARGAAVIPSAVRDAMFCVTTQCGGSTEWRATSRRSRRA